MHIIIRSFSHQACIYIMKQEVLGIASGKYDKPGIYVIYAFTESVFLSPQRGAPLEPTHDNSSCPLSNSSVIVD